MSIDTSKGIAIQEKTSLTPSGGSTTVIKNLDQCEIHVTRDKLELEIIKYINSHKYIQSLFIPIGILITCIGTLVSSNFNDWLLNSSEWKGVFYCLSAISIISIIILAIKAIQHRKERSVDFLISEICNEPIPSKKE